ncbi:unnamed protein product [Prorocentrum cordatum]|uniref:Uncharacterized protein n=1 Tax=Prorocentrum cordatum TaxID=2364126 RepID=A0ABN9USZ2_9DINO|nr:unnamed protein product [Polarella glacialis]
MRRYYSSHLLDFETFAKGLDPTLAGDDDVDGWLAKLFNASFLPGRQPDYGEKVPAAFADRHLAFSKAGRRRPPRAWRCLRGWHRFAPGRSRRPLLQAVWKAIAADLCLRGHKLMAAPALLGVGPYLRPHELMKIQPEDLPPPPARGASGHLSLVICPQNRGITTKTGAMGDIAALDCKWQLEPTPLWSALAGAPQGKPVWAFTCPELARKFKETRSQLGAPAPPDMMRHSGPSIDGALQLRPLDEVRKRGRWVSRKSVVRYETAARLSKAWHDLPLATRTRCEALDARLEELLLRGASRAAGGTERR